ncbi:MAG: ATP-dependent zinc protease [Hyphomicrobiaceae bacterium]
MRANPTSDDGPTPRAFVIGWQEWVALPDLALPAIKAKIDTGARTSALHAHDIEVFEGAAGELVRFKVWPARRRQDIEIACVAAVIDRRIVTSSNGESERRYVIATRMAMGGREWPIEVTLTDRSQMSYRMLLGRQAMQAGMMIDATSAFRQPRLSYRLYGRRRQTTK